MITNPPTDKQRYYFKRYASPFNILVGVVIGLGYASIMVQGYLFMGRLILSLFLFTAGVMGVSYFEAGAMRRRVNNYLPENLRIFYYSLFAFATTFLVRAIFAAPPVSPPPVLFLDSFLLGMTFGVIWMMSLTLFIGIRYNVGEWEVVRFPVWIGIAILFIYRKVLRQ